MRVYVAVSRQVIIAKVDHHLPHSRHVTSGYDVVVTSGHDVAMYGFALR